MDLKPGETVDRKDLHDEYGGQRYSGISTPADHDLVFLFTGDAGEEFGYRDEFRDDGTFVYTGEGQEGDMEMTRGNRAIRDHGENGDELHLFENTDWPYQVRYVGQYEYADHFRQELPDVDGQWRSGIRFELVPAGGREVAVEDDLDALSDEALYEQAVRSAVATDGGASSSGTSYPRSEVVKRFALRMADGVCRGCGEEAPFLDEDDEPFLEVHHLHRRSDGGADHPDNVVALCPNCHRRVHRGQDGDEFNQELIAHAEQRSNEFEAGNGVSST